MDVGHDPTIAVLVFSADFYGVPLVATDGEAIVIGNEHVIFSRTLPHTTNSS